MNTKFLQIAYMPRAVIPEKQMEINIQELLSSSINSSNYIKSIAIIMKK